MATLLQKLRTLFFAKLHDLADQAIEQNSLQVYDEYIRRAEQEIGEFRTTITPMFAQVKQSKQRRDLLATQAAKFDLLIDQFLVQGKKTEALVTQRRFASTMKLIEAYDDSLRRQVSAAETLHGILIKLEGRMEIAKQERQELAFLLEMAKAREISTKAMKSLDSLVGQGDGDLAKVAESVRQRLDHADAAWELQTNSLDEQLDSAMGSIELDAELAARMERLGISE